MQRAWLGQNKLRYRHLELVTIFSDAKIRSMHRPVRGLKRRPAGVLELLARLQQRLMPDNAQPSHLLHTVVRISNHPVTDD